MAGTLRHCGALQDMLTRCCMQAVVGVCGVSLSDAVSEFLGHCSMECDVV